MKKIKIRKLIYIASAVIVTTLYLIDQYSNKKYFGNIKNSETNESIFNQKNENQQGAVVSGFIPVKRIVDGDTILVEINGIDEKIRLIGVNTPETKDPRKPVQCFGKEASEKTKQALEGKKIKLETDFSQQDRDKYGRLLRYVFLEDGTIFNKILIEEGYAHEYTYEVPYKYQEEFQEAQKRAREGKKGLWGNSSDCSE